MNNEERDQALYRYPGSKILRNNRGIRDACELERYEREVVSVRTKFGVPSGSFDQRHLCAIHRHLFQDVYDWAGQFREVDFGKGKSAFHPHGRLEMGMADIHRRLSAQTFLKGLPRDAFAREAAEYIGDVNRLHPFRDGNGRTQFQYLKQLGAQAGHSIDLTRFDQESWIAASIEAHRFDCQPMAKCIERSITSNRQRIDMADLKRKAEKHIKERRARHSQDQSQTP